jgi:hypothetical protein
VSCEHQVIEPLVMMMREGSDFGEKMAKINKVSILSEQNAKTNILAEWREAQNE